jgi:hypothetical protein
MGSGLPAQKSIGPRGRFWTGRRRSTGAGNAASLQGMADEEKPREDRERTRRDIRAALIFGIVAATLELGALLYFFR